jgi:hypothetical protein
MGYYCHLADDLEAEALRHAFGEEVTEAIFYDAEEGGGRYELVVAYRAGREEFDRLTSEDPRWHGSRVADGPQLSVGDIPAHRGHTTKFSLVVPEGDDEEDGYECEGHETTRGAIGDTYFCDNTCLLL